MKCKLEIVTGFLGSGKTSFINSYIKTEICKNEKILIILLEKGNTEIDKNIESIYLKDIDELKDTIIKNIEKNNYNKIIIEVNGTILLDKVGDVLKDKDIRKKINIWKLFPGKFKKSRCIYKKYGRIYYTLHSKQQINNIK